MFASLQTSPKLWLKTWIDWFSWQRTMIQNLIVPLLLSFLTYYYLPAPETNLLGKEIELSMMLFFFKKWWHYFQLSSSPVMKTFHRTCWRKLENWSKHKHKQIFDIRFLPETLKICFSSLADTDLEFYKMLMVTWSTLTWKAK